MTILSRDVKFFWSAVSLSKLSKMQSCSSHASREPTHSPNTARPLDSRVEAGRVSDLWQLVDHSFSDSSILTPTLIQTYYNRERVHCKPAQCDQVLRSAKSLQLTHAAVVSKFAESARFKLGLWRPAFPVSDGSHRSEVTSVKCEAPDNTPSIFWPRILSSKGIVISKTAREDSWP